MRIRSIISLLAVLSFGSLLMAQPSREFLVSYHKDGKAAQEVLDLNDSSAIRRLAVISRFSEYKIEVISDSIKDIYDENGNLQIKRIDGYRRLSGQAYESYSHDERNQLVYKAAFDTHGEYKNGPLGIAVYEYSYDARGNQIEKRYFDEELRPVRLEDSGPAITRYDYDPENRLARVTYMDERGHLLKQRIAVEEYTYNNRGEQIEKIQRDREGKELNRLKLR